ncbi:hypothetical protein ACFOWX_02265 [Sphingorhabdus arenilitoris]|uniref:Alginate export domain-containing protein n=1 Tax=Sphingorhabdus arenilitoris TaxID=1490041 RepID=A0ABV8RE53_9SPHN
MGLALPAPMRWPADAVSFGRAADRSTASPTISLLARTAGGTAGLPGQNIYFSSSSPARPPVASPPPGSATLINIERPTGQDRLDNQAGNKPSIKPDKLQIYAYSYWRLAASEERNILAAQGQYGGSQSGIIATYKLNNSTNSDLMILTRLAAETVRGGDREAAVGLRWRPSRALPVSLSAEYRMRERSADAVAIYVATSIDDVAIAADIRASGFAQMGYVKALPSTPRASSAFFDAGARLEKPLVTSKPLGVAIGAGAWAGGQRGTQRIDIGPTLRLDASLSDIPLRLHADWRFRVGGNAQPGSGPALTLSTGF